MGSIGCDKTTLMRLFAEGLRNGPRFRIISARAITRQFLQKGHPVIERYGNDCNVIAEVLLDRYEQFVQRGMITHLTTNLDA